MEVLIASALKGDAQPEQRSTKRPSNGWSFWQLVGDAYYADDESTDPPTTYRCHAAVTS